MALNQFDMRSCGANVSSMQAGTTFRHDLRMWRSGKEAHWSTRLLGLSKLAFLPIISAAILFTWQGFTNRVQYFTYVSTSHPAPIATTIVTIVRNALGLPPPTTYETEQQMSAGELLDRWTPLIADASKRFGVPAAWVRTVVQMESGGRTMSGENQPIVSRAGAMGLMQLMSGTYQEMRIRYGLGANPFNPRDNILAGTAYLSWLHARYGYPAMFAAYNDGPGNFESRTAHRKALPQETRNYVSRIATTLGGGGLIAAGYSGGVHGKTVVFTRPNGAPVSIDMATITSVRAALHGEYAPGVNTVITAGHTRQGVREDLASVNAKLRGHGAIVHVAAGPAHHLRLAEFTKSRRISVTYSQRG